LITQQIYMQAFVLSLAVWCSLHVHLVSSVNLRRRNPLVRKKSCTKVPLSKSFIEAGSALVPTGPAGSGLGAKGPGVVADGYSRIACEVDVAPESQRISFKEHACGDGLKSCRLTELGMTPRLCFDFCRQYENAKFFGLHAGRDCYCSVYFHARSVGGEGECNAVCEGDKKEFCGGMEKSSLFEMHMCDDSATEAEKIQEMSLNAVLASDEVVKKGKATVDKVLALASSWKLNVCSIAPEGQRVCALPTEWTAMANKITGVSAELVHDTEVLNTGTKNLYEATEAVKSHAKDGASASEMSKAELLTDVVRNGAAKVSGDVEMMKGVIKAINGPIVGEALKTFDVFEALGDVKENWYAVCALVPVPGQSFAAESDDNPATCASKCLSLSTGTEACAAFNYQYKDGLAACQLLTATGVVEPSDAINAAVPIFEVSKTKRDAMGISSMGCYAHGRFTAGHPKGPLGIKVVKEVIVS